MLKFGKSAAKELKLNRSNVFYFILTEIHFIVILLQYRLQYQKVQIRFKTKWKSVNLQARSCKTQG